MAARPSGPPIIVVMGVSGAGKTTIASELASWVGWPMQDGDALHSPGSIAKMRRGEPLDDADRAPWLHRCAQWIDTLRARREPGVIACSALTRAYRDQLRRPEVLFAYLAVPAAELERRVYARLQHFMPGSLLASQLATLEPPEPDEHAVVVDGLRTPVEQVDAVLAAVRLGVFAHPPVIRLHA